MCDERGASVLAPMPTLDTPDASLDVGSPDGCEAWLSQGSAYERGGKRNQIPPFMRMSS